MACFDSSATKIDVTLTLIGDPRAVFDNLRCIEFSIVEDINTNIIAVSLSTEDWADERFLREFDNNLNGFGHNNQLWGFERCSEIACILLGDFRCLVRSCWLG